MHILKHHTHTRTHIYVWNLICLPACLLPNVTIYLILIRLGIWIPLTSRSVSLAIWKEKVGELPEIFREHFSWKLIRKAPFHQKEDWNTQEKLWHRGLETFEINIYQKWPLKSTDFSANNTSLFLSVLLKYKNSLKDSFENTFKSHYKTLLKGHNY